MPWRRNWQVCQGLRSLRRAARWSAVRLGFAALAGGAALAQLACVSAAPDATRRAGGAVAPASAVVPPSAGEGRPGQWLFRAEFSGDEGSASLRLLLRRHDAEHFTLTASDALGQARWEVRRDGPEALWLDPQARQFCRLDPRRALQARLALPSVAVADFPALLTGEWPPEDRRAAAPTAVTAARPFTGERSAAGPWTSWTLWQAGEPIAWFKRLDADSLLSVRRPAVQVRWRVTAQGDLPPATPSASSPASAGPGELPPGAREMACPDNAIP